MAGLGRRAALFAALLAVAACTQVTADISRQSALNAQSRGKSFAVVPLSGQRGNPEFEGYAQRVRQGLIADGMVAANDPAKADYAVFLRYGVTRGDTLYAATRTVYPPGYNDPLSTRLDTQAIRNDIKNQTNLAPITDTVGTPPPNARYLFNRSMQIDLVDTRKSTADKLATVYSGRASTVGQHSEMGLVGNCLIDAILDGFPAAGDTTVKFESESCEK
ncbi:MAG TPA: hypothetical protein VMV26_05245 [Alphaproteobacteria bacterium]|jgi:hypothetical protein|nr:hypothetical protein [Alphaproteobacteria bacterium]